MNGKQKIVVAVSTLLLLLATLVPPWEVECVFTSRYGSSDPTYEKAYGLLFNPPESFSVSESAGSTRCVGKSIELDRLALTYILVFIPTVGLVLLFSGQKPSDKAV